MNKLLAILPLVFLLCFTLSRQKAEEVVEEPAVDVEADIEAIKKWVYISYAIADAGELKDFLNCWAADVIWMPPNAPIIQGISALRGYVQPYFNRSSDRNVISFKEIKIVDDFAFARINFEESYAFMTGKDKPMNINIKIIILLQRMSDGKWLGTHCIWNRNYPLLTSQENP